MTLNIPRRPLVDEPLDVWRAHRDHPRRPGQMGELGRQALAQALTEAGIELGAYDERIVKWLGEFDLSPAVTVASWILRAHDAGLAQGGAGPAPGCPVTLDLDAKHVSFVLDDALREWAERQRGEAEDERADDPADPTAAHRLEWVAAADHLRNQIDAALDQPRISPALDGYADDAGLASAVLAGYEVLAEIRPPSIADVDRRDAWTEHARLRGTLQTLLTALLCARSSSVPPSTDDDAAAAEPDQPAAQRDTP